MKKRTAANFLVKVNGERYETSHYRRFLNHTRTIKWDNEPSVYLRVSYGTSKDVFGKTQTFYNDGDYNNQKDFTQAFEAFTEDVH